MKKLLIVIFAMLLCMIPPLMATKRAIIIGIGNYPQESGWPIINGDNDIDLVKQTLFDNHFSLENILVLRNEQATFANIRECFVALTSLSKKGDVVYVHFSGHGQLITDVNGDEPSDFDEAWIPYDASIEYRSGIYEGQNHLVDDTLNVWLHNIRNKVGESGNIIVIADACHSGGGSRTEDDSLIVRGTNKNFIIPIKNERVSQPNVEDWVYISACKSYQFNQQCKSRPYGVLTYALFCLRDALDGLSVLDLHAKLSSIISTEVKYSQTPVVDAPHNYLNMHLFR